MMRFTALRAALTTTGAVLAACLLGLPATASAQDGGRAKVLVVPIEAERGVDDDFGRKVAEKVRERLADLATLTAIEEDAVEDELDRLKLDADDLGLVQWRQLAGRLDADLLLAGSVSRTSNGFSFNVGFIDARTGDNSPIPEFSVQDDGGDGEDEAATQIMQAMEGQVEYQRALLFCADYLGSEEYEDARRNCEQALDHNPNSMQAKYLMGRVHMGQEQWAEAKENLDAVIEANPAEIDALNSLAYTEAQLGNTERSMELYREYLGFNPDDPSVRMQIAYDLAQAGDYDGAIALLEEGIARDSTNADMWRFLGDVSLNKGTTDDVQQVDDGSDAETTSTVAATAGSEVASESAIRRAIEAYEMVLEIREADTDPQILKNVVAAHLQLGDIDEAARFAERAEEQLPEDASLRSLKADVRARSGDFEGAVAAMDEALELNPELPRGLTKRGFFKLSAGNGEGALEDLRAAIDGGEDPEVVTGQLLSRGYNDHYKNGRYDRAIALFEVATEFAEAGPTLQQLYFFIGASHYQIGVEIDQGNQNDACQPARRALDRFEQVVPNLNRAGETQPEIQAQMRETTEEFIYREQAILGQPACQ
ncbi:MAG: tetratricopeptide repeat protein [Gemmatimonadota bacterium]